MARVTCSVHGTTTDPTCETCLHAMASVDGGDDPVGAGRLIERARIVAWLRSYDDAHRRSALADRIENGEHVSGREA